MGDLGIAITPRNLPFVNRLFGALGLRHTGDYVIPTRGTRVVRKDAELIEFECQLDPVLPAYPIVDVIEAGESGVGARRNPRRTRADCRRAS